MDNNLHNARFYNYCTARKQNYANNCCEANSSQTVTEANRTRCENGFKTMATASTILPKTWAKIPTNRRCSVSQFFY